MHELRDAEGRFVARSRSSVAAYRSSRRSKHFGVSVNRAVPHRARKFKPSGHFSAFVKRGDTLLAVYQGPSLSTARVRAKIAADKLGKPVEVMDEHFALIRTYRPGDSL